MTQMSTAQVEEGLRTMFADVLAATGPVGLDDDFFALGGHSLTAGRILGQIRRQFGARVTLAQFFEEPTVRGLTARVLAEQKSAAP